MSRKTLGGRSRVTAYGAASVALITLGALSTTAGATEVTGISLGTVTSGPTRGGVGVVEITGTGFTSAHKVFFGAVAAPGAIVESATKILVTPPAGTGTVDVSVTDGSAAASSSDGADDDYVYTDAATVTSKSLSSDKKTLTLNGSNLGGSAAVVSIGGKEAKLKAAARGAASLQSESKLEVTVPSGLTGGYYDAVVFAPKGTVVVAGAYGAPVKVTRATPDTATATINAIKGGTSLGGQVVRLFGTGFSGTSEVQFKSFGTAASFDKKAPFTVISDTELRLVTPAYDAAFPSGKVVQQVDLKVTNPGGVATVGKWTYLALPTVSAVSPATRSKSATGTVDMTVTGTNLVGVTAVKIGSTLTHAKTVTATKSGTQDSNGLTWKVKVPAAKPETSAGTTHVWVTTPAGTTKLTDGWTWS